MPRKFQVSYLFAIFVLALSLTAQAETPVIEWIRQMGTTEDDHGCDVITDSSGNAYVVGYTDGGIDGHTNVGSYGSSHDNNDIFLTKYDTYGNKIWTDQLGTRGQDAGYGVSIDGNGSIIVTGYVRGDLVDSGNTSLGIVDMVLIKYDVNGNKLWLEQMETNDSEHGNDVTIDSDGNIYVTGFVTSPSKYMPYVTKYDTNGNQLWIQKWGVGYQDYGKGVSVDANGNVYITGITRSSSSSRDYDSFLTKLNADGSYLWTEKLSTSTEDSSRAVSIDSDGNIYITGSTYGDLDGNTNAGNNDIFLAKYDTNGNKQWTQLLGTTGNDGGSNLLVDNNGNIYVSGGVQGDFDIPTAPTEYTDGFLTKFDSNGNRLWTEYLDSSRNAAALGVSIDSNGNLYVAGRTLGHFDGTSSAGGWDMFVAKISTVPEPTVITLIFAGLLALATFRFHKQ